MSFTNFDLTPDAVTFLVAKSNQALASGSQATGSLVALASASITDAETITLSDGVNTPVVFELNKSGGVTSGNVNVDISGATTAAEVATIFVAAVNAATTLGITASNVAGTSATVTLVGAYGALSNVTTWASTNTTINSSIVQPVGGQNGIYPTTGNSLGIADGQLGVISWDDTAHLKKGAFLTSGNNLAGNGANTKTDVKKIRIVQGTANSADISGLVGVEAAYEQPPVIMSSVIDSDNPITYVGKAAATALRSSFVVGDVTANNTSIPSAADETEYILRIAFEGIRHNKWMGTRNTDQIDITVKTPVFSTLSLTTKAQKVDWTIQNLVYSANLHSRQLSISSSPYLGKKPFIAFAIDIDGGGTGTALSSITAGTPFNYMTRNGVTYSYTPDAQFVATITEAIANSVLLSSSDIGVVNLSTAGAQVHDAILIVALDSEKAHVTDLEVSDKVRLRVGLNETLYQAGNLTSVVESSTPTRGQGSGRFYKLQYIDRAKKQVFTEQWMGMTTTFFTSPDYIVENQEYNVFIIGHGEQHWNSHSNMVNNPSHTFILVPSTSGTGEATTITSLNAVLAPWLNSCTFEHKDAPSTTLFV